ncbi:Phosphocarrier protein HPr [Agrobacterium tumefaciens]|nr:Phosphocarrier protein HPr [Agrobacterium tumefaciens]
MSPFTRELPIINKRGLHARASAKFVQMVEGFDATITVSKDGMTVGGTSIMGLMMLAASPDAASMSRQAAIRRKKRSKRSRRWSPTASAKKPEPAPYKDIKTSLYHHCQIVRGLLNRCYV